MNARPGVLLPREQPTACLTPLLNLVALLPRHDNIALDPFSERQQATAVHQLDAARIDRFQILFSYAEAPRPKHVIDETH